MMSPSWGTGDVIRAEHVQSGHVLYLLVEVEKAAKRSTANNKSSGHVRGYDTERPSWGQTAEAAWGGVDEPQAQGILTRPFVMGGFTWTGWDYKGEPTGPTIGYGWPDVNSHFGILDIAGFEKDRFYWYLAHFPSYKPGEGVLHLFPHAQQVEHGIYPV